jgi:hypothetical protein
LPEDHCVVPPESSPCGRKLGRLQGFAQVAQFAHRRLEAIASMTGRAQHRGLVACWMRRTNAHPDERQNENQERSEVRASEFIKRG